MLLFVKIQMFVYVCLREQQMLKLKRLGVSHSDSRENPNSNAVRGSASSAVQNSLSSFSIYLFVTILINILFIQCNFWFRLFEWRRYNGFMQIISFNVFSPITTILIQSLANIIINLDRYFRRNYIEFVRRFHFLFAQILSKQFLLNYFSIIFIGLSNFIVYLVLLFAENNNNNHLFGVTATAPVTATTILQKKPNFKLIATQFHHWLKQCTEMLNVIFADNDDYTTYYYTTNANTNTNINNNNSNFKCIIDNKFNLDYYKKPFFRAANHLTETQTHSTNQL